MKYKYSVKVQFNNVIFQDKYIVHKWPHRAKNCERPEILVYLQTNNVGLPHFHGCWLKIWDSWSKTKDYVTTGAEINVSISNIYISSPCHQILWGQEDGKR